MMKIEVRINGRLIASAAAVNQSYLDNISDYALQADETPHPVSGKNAKVINYMIKRHSRSDSVWSLVEKIAAIAKED